MTHDHTLAQSLVDEGKISFEEAETHPHRSAQGVLVTGLVAALSQREKDSFNHFRQGLQSLTVITFDELLHRLKLLYLDEDAATDDEPWPDEPLEPSDTEEPDCYGEDLPF